MTVVMPKQTLGPNYGKRLPGDAEKQKNDDQGYQDYARVLEKVAYISKLYKSYAGKEMFGPLYQKGKNALIISHALEHDCVVTPIKEGGQNVVGFIYTYPAYSKNNWITFTAKPDRVFCVNNGVQFNGQDSKNYVDYEDIVKACWGDNSDGVVQIFRQGNTNILAKITRREKGGLQCTDYYNQYGKITKKEMTVKLIGKGKREYIVRTQYAPNADTVSRFDWFELTNPSNKGSFPSYSAVKDLPALMLRMKKENRVISNPAPKPVAKPAPLAEKGKELLANTVAYHRDYQEDIKREKLQYGQACEMYIASGGMADWGWQCTPIKEKGQLKGWIYRKFSIYDKEGEVRPNYIVFNDNPQRVFYTENGKTWPLNAPNSCVSLEEAQKICWNPNDDTMLQIFKRNDNGAYPLKVTTRAKDGTQSTEHYNADGTISMYEKSLKLNSQCAVQAFYKPGQKTVDSFALFQFGIGRVGSFKLSVPVPVEKLSPNLLQRLGTQMLQKLAASAQTNYMGNNKPAAPAPVPVWPAYIVNQPRVQPYANPHTSEGGNFQFWRRLNRKT